ncbi:MAG TPA: uracil-DNA glycosylase [Allosphingosinicella sp.]|nr:uracil-DNA glycosylase [Allosphingosinicella sp.]
MEHLDAAGAASALSWWLDAGVDVVVGEAPRDWLRPAAPAPAPAPLETKAFAPPGAPAQEPLPDQLDLFRAWLQSSDALPHAAPAAPRVCPAGDPAAGLMIMIDMPSAEDCSAGTLLSGEVGRLFDRMLAAIGRDRSNVYFAALSCLRSTDGRLTGEPEKQCGLLARHHIGLAAPRALLLFGDGAAKALLGLPVTRARGRWHEVATHSGPVRTIPTISPRQLLSHPAQKAHAWADLQMLMEGLNG